MEFNFFVIWFIISPFIILHLYLKNREYKNKTSQVIDTINNKWDNEYKDILVNYGSIENYSDSIEKDFDTLRNFMVVLYENILIIRKNNTSNLERFLKLCDDTPSSIHTKRLINSIKLFVSSNNMSLVELNNFIRSVVEGEEEAHSTNRTAKTALDELDNKYSEEISFESKIK